jgi:hypothetical protein
MPIVVKTQQKPFSLHFPPFLTVFSADPNRESLDDSKAGPFSRSASTVQKR